MSTIVIVGAGLAGAKGVEALRDKGFDGKIVLFGAERQLPYERPPLSKDYLAGKKKLDDFTVEPQDWYRDHDVELHLDTTVTDIDVAGHSVGHAGGRVTYDKLLLATGSSARRPPIPGADADGVHLLRTIDDAAALDEAFWLDADRRVPAGKNVNVWEGLDDVKDLVRSGRSVDVDELANPDVGLSELAE